MPEIIASFIEAGCQSYIEAQNIGSLVDVFDNF